MFQQNSKLNVHSNSSAQQRKSHSENKEKNTVSFLHDKKKCFFMMQLAKQEQLT